jgi:hypothetical protein
MEFTCPACGREILIEWGCSDEEPPGRTGSKSEGGPEREHRTLPCAHDTVSDQIIDILADHVADQVVAKVVTKLKTVASEPGAKLGMKVSMLR